MAQNWTGSNWMNLISGGKKLSELTVPGTHDTCAIKSVVSEPDVYCQKIDVPTQLTSGIRFLDIRCRQYQNGFPIHHGSYYLKTNFGNIQQTCVNFLQQNPSECIFLKVKPEYEADDNTETFEQIFNSYVYGTRTDGYNQNYSSYWYFGNEIPTLDAVRGRIVLLREFALDANSAPLGIDFSRWPDNSTFEKENPDGVTYYIQDQYKIATEFNTGKKWDEVHSLLKIAKDGTSDPTYQYTWFLNFTSASGGAYPVTVATGDPGGVKGVNTYLKDFLTSDPSFLEGIYRWGTIICDFPDQTQVSKNENLIQLIVKCNGI